MTTTQTALMPVDPAVSPAQAARVLTIRANLLPEEIRAGRAARRTRFVLIGAVLAVVAGLASWYMYAVREVDTARENLTMATDQVRRVQNEKKKYSGVTDTINDVKTVQQDLKALLITDLPWATTMDRLRSDAVAAEVEIDGITGTMADPAAGGAVATSATNAKTTAVASFSITGSAADRKHVADYLDRLATMPGFTDPYLVITSQENKDQVTYSLTVKIAATALCGRFTTTCKTGDN